MISWECVSTGSLTECQIPYTKQWLSGITDLVLFIAIIWFVIHMVIRILGRLVK